MSRARWPSAVTDVHHGAQRRDAEFSGKDRFDHDTRFLRGWREGQHDDFVLILSVTLPDWWEKVTRNDHIKPPHDSDLSSSASFDG